MIYLDFFLVPAGVQPGLYAKTPITIADIGGNGYCYIQTNYLLKRDLHSPTTTPLSDSPMWHEGSPNGS